MTSELLKPADILWDAVKDTLYVTREQYEASLAEWDVSPVKRGETVVAYRISKGPEFHFVMTGEVKSVTRADVRACIRPIIEIFGYATTRTPKLDTRQQRFNELLGFVKTGEDELDIHYRLGSI